MSQILPADKVISPQVTAGGARTRRPLSSRRVRKLVAIGQLWADRDGQLWTVRQVHRKDRQVALTGPGERPKYVTFAELGHDYRPLQEMELR